MRVTLREKRKGGKNGSRELKSLYLDIYLGSGIKRQYEFLGLEIFAEPKTKLERAHNAEILQAAKIIMAERETEVQTGKYGIALKERSNGLTVGAFFRSEAAKRKPQTANNWRFMINHLEAAKLDTILLSSLKGEHCLKFRDYLAGLVSSKKLGKFGSHNYLTIFRTGLRSAYRARLTKENLVNRFEHLPNGQSTRQFLTQEELDKFASTKTRSPVSRDVFLFSALCGMRISDIRALTWESVFDMVVRDEYGVPHEVSEVRYTMRKTGKAHVLPLPKQARQLLGVRGSGLVWKWLPDHSTLSENIKRIALRAGIDKEITTHCARHTCATLLLSKGVALKTVSQMLGHASVRTTEIYAKVLESSTRSAADLMSFTVQEQPAPLRLVK